MEEKANGRNPFSDARTEKKLKIAKNRLKQAKNMQRKWLVNSKVLFNQASRPIEALFCQVLTIYFQLLWTYRQSNS